MHVSFYLYLFLNLVAGALTYTIPDPKVELINPKGVRLSIPHENGIVITAFHVNIGKAIAFNQPGDYTADITEPTDGKWIFDITQAFVDSGDMVSYWMHVQYGNIAYRKLGGSTVSGEPIEIGEPITPEPIKLPIDVGGITPSTPRNCEPSKTTVNRKPACKGQLIFEDNFDYFNDSIWKHEVRIPTFDDVEFVSYQDRPENCYVRYGELHIVPNLLSSVPGFDDSVIRSGILNLAPKCLYIIDDSECRKQARGHQILPPVVSARIRTKDFFSFCYGTVEVRAKMPKGDWLFPLILLEPQENRYGILDYASGQMRVAFSRGNTFLEDKYGNNINGNRILGGVVLSSKHLLRESELKGSEQKSHLGNDFHTYTLTWTDEAISLKIDGREYASIPGGFSSRSDLPQANHWKDNEFMAPFDREFFLTLGVSAGGHSDFPDGSRNGPDFKTKPWRNLGVKAELNFWKDRSNWSNTWYGENAGLHVDYIRVYAL